MTVQECYARLGGDYPDVLRRLTRDDLISKILSMLLKDRTMDELRDAMAQGDMDAAFRAAHTMKGVLLNLCLTPAAQSVSALAEALRAGRLEDVAPLFAEAERSYGEVRAVVEELVEAPENQS